jgi:hypothetical protein
MQSSASPEEIYSWEDPARMICLGRHHDRVRSCELSGTEHQGGNPFLPEECSKTRRPTRPSPANVILGQTNGLGPAWAQPVQLRSLPSASLSDETSSGRPTGAREVGELVGFCRSPGKRAGRSAPAREGRLSSQSPRGSPAVYASWTTSFLSCQPLCASPRGEGNNRTGTARPARATRPPGSAHRAAAAPRSRWGPQGLEPITPRGERDVRAKQGR